MELRKNIVETDVAQRAGLAFTAAAIGFGALKLVSPAEASPQAVPVAVEAVVDNLVAQPTIQEACMAITEHPNVPESVTQWQPEIMAAAEEFDVHPDMLAILMTLESRGDPTAVSHVGAQGLLQIMPGTAAEIAARLGKSDYDMFDPATNVRYSAEFLSWLDDNYVPDEVQSPAHILQLLAIGYNGGPKRIEQTLLTAQANGVNLAKLTTTDAAFRYNQFVANETRGYASKAFTMWTELHPTSE